MKKNINPIKNYSPMIYEKTDDGAAVYDVFSRLMKERILFLGEDIEPDMANSLISQMLWLDKQNNDPIDLYINSGGGDLNSMFAIYDVMQYISSPINTYVMGIAASAAAVLLSAGSKGCRYSLPNSEIMIHQPLTWGVSGQITDIEITGRQLSKAKERMLNILTLHSGKTYEEVQKDCERDYWLNPKEAVAYGLIDNVIEPTKDPLKEIKKISKKKKRVPSNKESA